MRVALISALRYWLSMWGGQKCKKGTCELSLSRPWWRLGPLGSGLAIGCTCLFGGMGLKFKTLFGQLLQYVVWLRANCGFFASSTSKCTSWPFSLLTEVTTCWSKTVHHNSVFGHLFPKIDGNVTQKGSQTLKKGFWLGTP